MTRTATSWAIQARPSTKHCRRRKRATSTITSPNTSTKPSIDLTDEDRGRIKQGARQLLDVLKREKLVLDWRKRQQARAQVRTTIEEVLDETLPAVFTAALYQQKVDAIYQHIFDAYYGQGRSIYGPAA